MKLNFIKFNFSLLVIFFLFVNRSFAFDSTYAAQLQATLNQIRAFNNIPGISAAVIVPGQGVWTGTSGISDSANVMNPDMIFGIGSITKNIVAAATLKLHEMNLLDIDDPIHMYLPRYNNVDSNITIRELLQQTSGIYNYTDNPAYTTDILSNPNRMWKPEEVMAYVLAPVFPHGTSWRYSNTNYVLLELIINKVQPALLASTLKTLLYQPNNLNDIILYPYEKVPGYLVHNWADFDGNGTIEDVSHFPKISLYSSGAGAGSVMTKPVVLANWGKLLFEGNVLTPASLQQMVNFRNVSFGTVNGYGLGTMRYPLSPRSLWGHGGNVFGFASILLYSPTDSIVIAMCANKDLGTTTFGLPFMNSVIMNRPVGIKPISQEIPANYELKQNYPNPFNPETTIEFNITKPEFTGLQIYDINGRLIETLVNEKLSAGTYKLKWNGSNVSSGIYYYTLKANNYFVTKKMILLK